MRVIVNLQPLLTPLTGIGHYTRELTLQLLAAEPAPDVIGLTGSRFEPVSPPHPLLAEASTTAVSEGVPFDERGPLGRFARRYLRNALTRRLYRELIGHRLRRQGRELAARPDTLYWEPNYALLPWQGRSVVTVHDLSHERHPAFHPRERVDFLARHLPDSLARATRINVVSRFTAEELQRLHGVDPQRIDIVPPGVASRFFVRPGTDTVAALRARYRLPPRYLLSVGTLEPRKNLARVMQAFAGLPVARQQAMPLLLAGMPGWGEQRLSADVRRALERGTIRRLGYVDAADLPALYAQARGFVYVSLYEGFGMPVLEAMAAGTPVLTADATATREVAAGAAITVDPRDEAAIRRGLERLVEDDHERRLADAHRRAGEFTWQHSAARLRASFLHALATERR